MLGSDGERTEGRHKINALISRFGNPALFLTFNPHHDHNPSLRAFAGVEQVDLTEFVFSNVTKEEATKLAEDTHLAARWFKLLLENIIENMLGWSISRQEPKKGGGVFGVVQAYVLAIEEQQRGM
jgi:hypothetical protein